MHRNTYRIFCLLAAILPPAFGIMYHFSNPGTYDPLWGRIVLAGLALLLLALSYTSTWVLKHLIPLVHSLFYALTSWFVFITALNHFPSNYALGLLFSITAVGVAFSLGLERTEPLARYLAFTVLATLIPLFSLSNLEVSRPVMATSIFSTALVIFVVAHAKNQAEEAVKASEHRYHTLMNAANDAIFIADPATDRLLDANQKAQELIGQPLDKIRQMKQADLFPPEKRDHYHALFNRHVHEDRSITEDLFVVNREGRFIPVDISASLIDLDNRQLIQGIFRDATERHHYEEQLIQAKERAEELLRLKSSFLNNMSHELRTPLTSILGLSKILKEEAPNEQREYAQTINDSAERLHNTLNSVLDLVQLESGEATLDLEALNVVPQVESTVSELQPVARRKNIDLVTTKRTPEIVVETDATCLHRIVYNLVNNAIKFTDEGRVTVEIDEAPDRIFIRVHDTGIGISREFLQHLFDEFRQESQGLARSHEGSGLGLAVTKRLVDLMGGSIDVASEQGRGSIFTVALPRKLAQDRPSLDRPTPEPSGSNLA